MNAKASPDRPVADAGGFVVEHVPVDTGALWTATTGSGVPLVLAHGGPGLSNNLQPVARMVEDIAQVHLYDQRGGGRSSAGGSFDIATFIDDLETLREHWGHERWFIGGHSWGAALGLFYAFAHPDCVLGVVYLGGTGIRRGFLDTAGDERMRRLTDAERAELEAINARLPDVDEAERARFLRLLWSTDFASRQVAAAVLDDGPLYEYPRSEEVAHAIHVDWAKRVDAGFADEIRGLDIPVLVLHGEQDPDPRGAQEVADLAPQGEWAPVLNAGHSLWLEQPEAVRDRLRSFLASSLG